ncbi:MAG: AI-2E family transporter [Blastochloris sp.]|nr:AI-2E family transporter [Blastochloris sp.]
MSAYTVFRNTLVVLATIALCYLLVVTLDVWLVLLIGILVASAVRPYVNWLRARRVPEAAAVLGTFLVLALIAVILLLLVLPPVVNQVANYLQNDNLLANRLIVAQGWVERFLSDTAGNAVEIGIPADDVRAAVSELVDTVRLTAPELIDDIGGFVGNLILVLVIGIYWATSRERSEGFIISLLPLGRQAQAQEIFREIETSLGAYVRGVVLISLIVGVATFIALTLFRVPNAVSMSFIYGIATAIPIVGGFVGVVFAVGLALLNSPQSALVVFVVTLLIQQVAVYWLSPRLLSRGADFNELLVIVFIACGFALEGVGGALLAIPVAGTLAILLRRLVLEPRQAKVAPQRVEGGVLLHEKQQNEPSVEVLTNPKA